MNEKDKQHLERAYGWMELQNWKEANAELSKISPEHGNDLNVACLKIDVLYISSLEKNDEELIKVSCNLLSVLDPASPVGAIRWHWHLCFTDRAREAWESMSEIATRFPNDYRVCFGLAYAAHKLGKEDFAERNIAKAFGCVPAADARKLRNYILGDDAFKPLWAMAKRASTDLVYAQDVSRSN